MFIPKIQLKTYYHQQTTGFPTGAENMGGEALQNLMGVACVTTWGKHGGLKTLLKNTFQGVPLLVKLLAISLQTSKFTKNELLRTYFSSILARFKLLFIAF